MDLNGAEELISEIKKGNIRLLLDTGNLELEKMDLKKVFSKNQKIIEHVQLSNKNLNCLLYTSPSPRDS